VVFVLLLQEIDHYSGNLFYVILLLFWLCASVMLLGLCVVTEARYNWYICDINIYSLSKNMVEPQLEGDQVVDLDLTTS
jgi:hypothetical protein